MSDGGPTCAAEMTFEFRLTMNLISIFINVVIIYLSWPTISKCKETDMALVKNPNPNWLEKIIGYCCYFIYFLTVYYKLKTGRGVFMNNPCHICLLL